MAPPVTWTKLGPIGPQPWSADHYGQPSMGWPPGPHLWPTRPITHPESESTCPVGLSRGKERVSQVFIQKQVLPSSFSLFPYLPHLLNPSRIPPSSEHRSSCLARTPTPLSLPELINLGHVTPWRSILLRFSRKRFAR